MIKRVTSQVVRGFVADFAGDDIVVSIAVFKEDENFLISVNLTFISDIVKGIMGVCKNNNKKQLYIKKRFVQNKLTTVQIYSIFNG